MLMENPGAPAGQIDDLRVGLDWADVTGGQTINNLTIEQEPADQTQNAGGTALFSVGVAGGSPPLAYQWRLEGTNLSDTADISGANTASLSISNLVEAYAGGYSVIVTDAFNSVTSSVATLTVNDPFITSQPVKQVLHREQLHYSRLVRPAPSRWLTNGLKTA